jgi:DNA gyrase subunit A
MVVADPAATLLTVCERGYGKRTNFGPNTPYTGGDEPPTDDESAGESVPPENASGENAAGIAAVAGAEPEEEGDDDGASGARYRTQRRGGLGLRDIKATARNGKVIGIIRVDDTDEVLMMTARGKIQRIAASDMSVIGRNTQGVRIMTIDDDDTLAAVVRVPKEEVTPMEETK